MVDWYAGVVALNVIRLVTGSQWSCDNREVAKLEKSRSTVQIEQGIFCYFKIMTILCCSHAVHVFVGCRWWQLPYYYAGIKCYDIVSGRQLLKSSYILSKSKALELFPMLKKDKLVGGLVYYDG